MTVVRKSTFWMSLAVAGLLPLPALAESALPALGMAAPWQLNLQSAGSPVQEEVISFHTLLLWIITAISVFVLALLLYVSWRFRASANPNPSRSTHNTLLEVVWTGVPVLILVIIAVPSFRLLYFQDGFKNADMTIKAIGKQWYWTYEYPDHGNFTFDAYMLSREEAAEVGKPGLLATDYEVVVPTETNVRVLITGADVLHSWAMPSLGVKMDAVPGRLNESWFRIEQPGMYYGQCSELCGVNHGFMPIAIRAVPQADFDAWVQEAQAEFAMVDTPDVNVAQR